MARALRLQDKDSERLAEQLRLSARDTNALAEQVRHMQDETALAALSRIDEMCQGRLSGDPRPSAAFKLKASRMRAAFIEELEKRMSTLASEGDTHVSS